jgi:hypothetical protein
LYPFLREISVWFCWGRIGTFFQLKSTLSDFRSLFAASGAKQKGVLLAWRQANALACFRVHIFGWWSNNGLGQKK